MVYMYVPWSNQTVGKDHFNSGNSTPHFMHVQIRYKIENFQSVTRNCPRVDRENNKNA